MKVGTLICSMLFGLTFIHSVFAISVEDRRVFCEQYPDKYVWVKETKACIPINPCESTVESVREVYCEDIIDQTPSTIYANKQAALMFVNNVRNTRCSDVREIANNTFSCVTDYDGYLAIKIAGNSEYQTTEQAAKAACWANGGWICTDEWAKSSGEEGVLKFDVDKTKELACCEFVRARKCQDIATDANVLKSGSFYANDKGEGLCVIGW